MDSSFWLCKVYAGIRNGSLERSHQTTVGSRVSQRAAVACILRIGSTPFRLIPFCAGLGTETLTLTISDVIYNGLGELGFGELGLGEMGGHLRISCVRS